MLPAAPVKLGIVCNPAFSHVGPSETWTGNLQPQAVHRIEPQTLIIARWVAVLICYYTRAGGWGSKRDRGSCKFWPAPSGKPHQNSASLPCGSRAPIQSCLSFCSSQQTRFATRTCRLPVLYVMHWSLFGRGTTIKKQKLKTSKSSPRPYRPCSAFSIVVAGLPPALYICW